SRSSAFDRDPSRRRGTPPGSYPCTMYIVHSRPLADGAEGHSLRVVLMRALRDQVVVVMASVVIWEFPADIGASIIYRAASRCLRQKLTRRSVYAILPVSEHAAVAGDDFREPVGTENAIRENRAGISPSQ